MYPDLMARLRQDIRKINRNELYFVCDHSLADGSFLLYHFISLYLRSPENGRVYVLALNHPSNHYKIVLAKLGVQLQRQIEQNRCRILDFSHYLSMDENVVNADAPWFGFVDHANPDPNSNSAENAVQNLYIRMKGEIQELTSADGSSTSGSPLLIIIDCLSVLLDFRVPLKYVIQFVHYLGNFAKSKGASIAILTKTDDEFSTTACEDRMFTDYDRLAAYLSSWGSSLFETTFVFDVRPLATGWSQDVHGEVTIRELKALDNVDQQKDSEIGTRLLYRLSDRNVTFMAPGLVPRIGV